MNYYCPSCGRKLRPLAIDHDLWIQFFQCDTDGCEKTFAKVIDLKNDYPLIEVFPNVPEKINELTVDEAREAWDTVKFVDYKTVSLVDFEHYLLRS